MRCTRTSAVRVRFVFGVACLFIFMLAAIRGLRAADETPPTSGPQYQDLIYLGTTRPIVIRLYLQVDGEPFGQPWSRYAQQLFAAADQDGDGRLTETERKSPSSPDNPLQAELMAVLSTPGLLQADFDPPDSVLSLAEFAAFVGDRRGGEFQASQNISSAPDAQPQPALQAQNANAGAALFKALDAQADGQLSVDDLHRASDSLRRLDFDSDGACSVDELDHLRSPFVAVPQADPGTAPLGIPLHVRSPGEPSAMLVERLLRTYGGNATQLPDSLSIEQLGYRAEDLAAFDAGHDSRLDREELRYWLAHAGPQVELTVHVGNSEPGLPPVEVRTPPTLEGLSVKVTPAGLVSLVDGNVQLEFGVSPATRTEESLRQSFVQSFKMFDSDGNGYLDRNESGRSPYFEAGFSRFDRDADAKVFEAELLAAATGEILTALSRTSVAIDNRGKDLFEILDTSRDRRVSRRELLESVDRFTLWDANADGQLSDQEVPQLYQLQFERGAPPLPALVGANRLRNRGVDDPAMQGPVWFQRMDRNGDGDVAFREFIGTSEQFRQLDVNGDALIDVGEAVLINPAP